MNLKALITSLCILGSSAAAMARPVTITASAHASWSYGAPAPIVRDHRAPRVLHTRDTWSAPNPGAVCGPAEAPAAPPPFVPQWTTLGTVNQIVDGEMAFRVAPSERRGAPYSLVKLQWASGKALVYRVKIQFASGRTQEVAINKYLNASTPVLSVDVAREGRDASPITSVTIIGRNARQSAFSVLAI